VTTSTRAKCSPPATKEHHIDKKVSKSRSCAAAQPREALRRIAEARHDPHQGRGRLGNIVGAVRHIRTIVKQMKQLAVLGKEELVHQAKELQAPLELVEWVRCTERCPRPTSRRRHSTPADAALVMQLAPSGVRGSESSSRSDPARRPGHRAPARLRQSREAARGQPLLAKPCRAGYRQNAGVGLLQTEAGMKKVACSRFRRFCGARRGHRRAGAEPANSARSAVPRHRTGW